MNNPKSNMYQYDKETSSSMAAGLNKNLVNIRNQNLKKVLAEFEGGGHKLEYVKSIKDVDFIDDSCSTTANAVWYALESMHRPVTWIMNISDLDVITESLLECIEEKVKKIVIQGVYNSEIIDFFTGLGKEVFFAMNLEDAVRSAFYACDQGDVILFSPGAPSDGFYPTYKERGDKFQDAIAQL